MCRRLLLVAVLAVVAAAAAGCADDVAPAARAGDSIVISNDDLLAEVAEWAVSPALLDQVGITATTGAAPGSWASPFVSVVLTNRIRFDLHQQQFDALGLTVSDAETASLREQLGPVLDQLDPEYADRLVDDLAHLNAVSQSMGDGYEAWFAAAASHDVEVNPRYGSWDQQAGAVTPPEGPRSAPADQLLGA